jgi:hypothetical protein
MLYDKKDYDRNVRWLVIIQERKDRVLKKIKNLEGKDLTNDEKLQKKLRLSKGEIETLDDNLENTRDKIKILEDNVEKNQKDLESESDRIAQNF